MSAIVESFQVQRARTFVRAAPPPSGGLLELDRLLGRVTELSEAGAFGALSLVCELMRQVQAQGEQLAWIATGNSVFFPPDLQFRGLDVRAISVALVPGCQAGLQACDWLVRSGAFALVLVDWGGEGVEEAFLARLSRMAEDRRVAVLFLTRKKASDPSLGTQVSLRGAVSPTPTGETEVSVLKDKRSGPLTRQKVTLHGPFGLY